MRKERVYGTKHTKFTGDLPNEIWKNVVGYDDIYEISNLGRVKSLPKQRGTMYTKVSYLLKSKETRDGYLSVTLKNDLSTWYPRVHRLAAIAFIENPDNYPQVNHKDGNKKNNNVENLEWCTCKENINHAWDTGINKHRPSPMRKLTIDQAGEIRRLYSEDKISQCKIGEIFGKSHSLIGKIVRNERYVL